MYGIVSRKKEIFTVDIQTEPDEIGINIEPTDKNRLMIIITIIAIGLLCYGFYELGYRNAAISREEYYDNYILTTVGCLEPDFINLTYGKKITYI